MELGAGGKMVNSIYSDDPSSEYYYIYYYDEDVDFSTFGYVAGQTEGSASGSTYLFKNFTLNNKEVSGKQKAQSFLTSHTTNTVIANYTLKPSADVGLDGPSTLSINNNKVSGVIEKQIDRKYYIPVTLTSSKFKDGVTTVDVIDPNGHTDTIVYNDASKIARISSVNDKKINLQLEAIKENAITGDNGKEYTINLYIDGKENGNQAETYVIDYSKTMTEEEIINLAAKNTQNLNSLTTVKDNHVKSGVEKFTYMFDREKGFTHYKSSDDTLEQYSFRIKYLYSDHTTNTSIVVSKKTDTPSDKPEEHTYQVILNKEAFEKWINATYVSLDNNVQEEVVPNDEDAVTLTVVLDDSEQYVKSIKTEKDFTVSSNELHYSNLSINVQYSNFDNTDIAKPEEMLRDAGGEATIEELKQLYEAGKIYWKKHTGAEIFEG